jgi:hypothetical protein
MKRTDCGQLGSSGGPGARSGGSGARGPPTRSCQWWLRNGDFTGWTGTGNTTFNGVQCPGPGPTVFQGNCSAFFGPIGASAASLRSSPDSSPGDFYTLSTPWLPDGGNPSQFQVIFDGVTLVNSVIAQRPPTS